MMRQAHSDSGVENTPEASVGRCKDQLEAIAAVQVREARMAAVMVAEMVRFQMRLEGRAYRTL